MSLSKGKVTQALGFVLCVVLSAPAFAQLNRGKFESKQESLPNLIREGESVAILKEKGVQEEAFMSRRVYAMTIGQMTAQRLVLTSYDHSVEYDLVSPTGTLGAQFGYYPVSAYGLWGIHSSVNYTNIESRSAAGFSEVLTSLHWMMADALFMYRGEGRLSEWIKPELGIGLGMIGVIQRGPDQYNTSEAKTMGVGVLGASMNLTRLFSIRSPLQWDLLVQYKAMLGPSKAASQWNGSMINAGLALAL